MKVSQPMVAQQGQIYQEQYHLHPTSKHQLQSQKALIYHAIKWNQEQQNSFKLMELQILIGDQLPKLPTEYIHKIISDKHHTSLIMILHRKVVGGATFRLFYEHSLVQLVFFAIDKDYQGQGFGKRLMQILKEFLNIQSIQHVLTFADDSARIFFKKLGFSKDITLQRSVWQGLIKQYSGSKLMQCEICPSINYIIANQFIQKQKAYINQQIKKVCLVGVVPKKTLISAIKQKKSFLDSLLDISLAKLIKKLPGFDNYEQKSKNYSPNLSNFRVSVQQECRELMYEILNLPQTQNFHLDKYFYEKTLNSQNKLNGVNFPTICRKIENDEYQDLKQFIQDMNSFILLIKDQYKDGVKKESVKKLAKFIQSKIENLLQLQEISSAKQVHSTKIQQEKPIQKNR